MPIQYPRLYVMRDTLWLLLFLAFTVAAAAAASTPRWFQVQTPHFTVITNASDKDARRVAAQFERMRALRC